MPVTNQTRGDVLSRLTTQQLHAMLGVYAVLFLLGLETTIGGAILPQAAAELEGLERFAWGGTLQMLVSACATPITARLGDIWGRKWMLLAAVAVLCLAGVLAALADSMALLLATRALNGLALGMLAGAAFAVPADVFADPAQRLRWQSVGGVMFAIASSLGPLLGAALSEVFGWRTAMLAVPVATLPVLLMLYRTPSIRVLSLPSQHFDWRGGSLLCVFIVSSLLVLQDIPAGPGSLSWTVLAGVAMALFWRQQLRTSHPVLALEILRNGAACLIVISTLFSGAALFLLMFYSPLLLTTLTGVSLREAGTLMLPLLVGMPLGSVLNGWLFRSQRRPQRLLLLGAMLLVAGCAVLVMLPQGVSPLMTLAGFALCGVGLGFINQNQTVFIQLVAPIGHVGVATGLISTARTYGGALGSALVGLAIQHFGLHEGLALGLVLSLLTAVLIVPIALRIKLP